MPTAGHALRAALASNAVLAELLNHLQASGVLTFEESGAILSDAKSALVRKGGEDTLGAALVIDSIRERLKPALLSAPRASA
jgi:hypothetical protein